MVIEPHKWGDGLFGGTLTNQTQKIDLITGSILKHGHKMENRTNLYNAINNMSKIKFGINNCLLKFLENEGSYLLVDNNLTGKKLNQQKLNYTYSMKIANIFRNTPFYLNLTADWRGRMYVNSTFISYQSNELALGLLQFWSGEPLTEEGLKYLYIYGANLHNENSISKNTNENRIKWVEDNYNKIIQMDQIFISSAESKILFAAFCLEMNKLDKDPNAIINFPLFLDATCSGVQHLTALIRDTELANLVNIKPQTDTDKVADFYSELVKPINKAINEYGKKNSEFRELQTVYLPRQLLKQPIMTKNYNVKVYGISQQLKNKLPVTKLDELAYVESNIEIVKQLTDKFKISPQLNFWLVPSINGTDVPVSAPGIYKIAQIINDEIFVRFPKLRTIYNYFLEKLKFTNK